MHGVPKIISLSRGNSFLFVNLLLLSLSYLSSQVQFFNQNIKILSILNALNQNMQKWE